MNESTYYFSKDGKNLTTVTRTPKRERVENVIKKAVKTVDMVSKETINIELPNKLVKRNNSIKKNNLVFIPKLNTIDLDKVESPRD